MLNAVLMDQNSMRKKFTEYRYTKGHVKIIFVVKEHRKTFYQYENNFFKGNEC